MHVEGQGGRGDLPEGGTGVEDVGGVVEVLDDAQPGEVGAWNVKICFLS